MVSTVKEKREKGSAQGREQIKLFQQVRVSGRTGEYDGKPIRRPCQGWGRGFESLRPLQFQQKTYPVPTFIGTALACSRIRQNERGFIVISIARNPSITQIEPERGQSRPI